MPHPVRRPRGLKKALRCAVPSCMCVIARVCSRAAGQLLIEAHGEKHTQIGPKIGLIHYAVQELNKNEPGKSCNNSPPT